MNKSLAFFTRSCTVAFFLSLAALCNAQTLPATDATVDQVALDADARLAAPVSLEVKRKPLGQLLGEVSKQSGVSLSLVAGSLDNRVVTARVRAMPLSELMGSLARIYDASWNRTPRGFELHDILLAPLDKMTLQAERFRTSHLHAQWLSEEELDELRRDFFREWADKNPKFAPMPISEIPEDIQTRLRAAVTQQLKIELVRTYIATTLESPEASLHFVRQGDSFRMDSQLTASASDKNHTTLFQLRLPPVIKKREQPPLPPGFEQFQPQQTPPEQAQAP